MIEIKKGAKIGIELTKEGTSRFATDPSRLVMGIITHVSAITITLHTKKSHDHIPMNELMQYYLPDSDESGYLSYINIQFNHIQGFYEL